MEQGSRAGTAYFRQEDCSLEEFKALVGQSTQKADVPLSTEIQHNIPIYDMAVLESALDQAEKQRALMAEWASVLRYGAGVIVLQKAYSNTGAIDRATAVYDRIITDEKAKSGGGADHFAAAGANDRIWNSLQKLCEADAEVFVDYFANTAIAAACEAWLGPNYQMTAQVNLVHPGGQAQQAHRDYHLGFQSAELSAEFPAHVHDISPALTLQGGIAHCDMSVKSGPTKFLPFSQSFRPGYTAWRRQDFRDLFEDQNVQVPLKKGDAVFFSPALFHAAGANKSKDIHRMVNLLQVSSAFGRAMETLDRYGMCKLIYPVLAEAKSAERLSAAELSAAIAATAEGYSFPTNLDNDPPVGGLAPETQAALLCRALETGMSKGQLDQELTAQAQRQSA